VYECVQIFYELQCLGKINRWGFWEFVCVRK